MKITVIGTGYVGLIAGICFADFGYDVMCMDTDEGKIEKLRGGVCPIYEQGAEAILQRSIKKGTISFTSDPKAAIEGADVVFITVGTPSNDSGQADMSSYYSALGDIADNMNAPLVIVNKSTVPIGTGAAAREFVKEKLSARGADIDFSVASNPEFLREGKSVGDFLNPDRIVIGTDNKATENKLLELYSVFNRSNKPIVATNIETAETIKYACNAFLATKIAFINEIANLCTASGANVNEVAHAMGMDGRISPKFLHAGPGYGGSCFPKDRRRS